MFKKLRQRWELSTIRVVLVLCTFAVAGSLSGIAARKLMHFLEMEKGVFYWLVYLLIVSLIWPLAVLTVSIPFGQFSFFKAYLRRMSRRLGFAGKQNDSAKSEHMGSSDAMEDRL